MGLILLTILLVILVLILPAWPYSRDWGYNPMAIITLLLILVIVLIFTDILVFWKEDQGITIQETEIFEEKEGNRAL